jgi:chemotaxis protein methyltransferase CheR
MQIDAPESDQVLSDDGFRALVSQIESRTRFQGQFYKEKCLRRRLAVRMRARGLESFAAYAELLEEDPREYELLLDALTINVSKFFRNRDIWMAIEELVVPALFEAPQSPKRIWSAGCAGGEEPYSVSILLHEWAARNGAQAELADFQIVGTDIDRRSLAVAQRAEYPELALAETPPELQERWFSPRPPFRLDPAATENVTFEHRDLISGEPHRDLSLILCRNVIIYFDREIQEELFQRFYDALLPGGFLVLGKVETLLGRPRSLFRPVSHRDRIFRKPA